ncbi:hypothetical protein [Exiguobacterium sp. s193]|uniref:hypothetical protein n=1 Tax=Exiguobacterium sp. s193 TaxID=2751207 RepID=UPI001BEAF9BD|nr:hypothetical protein [Exiguobacterium sp. s193]
MKMYTRIDTHDESAEVPSETRLGFYFLLIVLPLGLAHLVQSLVPSTDQHHLLSLSLLTFFAILLFAILGHKHDRNAKATFFSYALFLGVSLLSTLAIPII